MPGAKKRIIPDAAGETRRTRLMTAPLFLYRDNRDGGTLHAGLVQSFCTRRIR